MHSLSCLVTGLQCRNTLAPQCLQTFSMLLFILSNPGCTEGHVNFRAYAAECICMVFFFFCVCVCVSIHVCTLSHHSMCVLWMWPRGIRRMRVYIFRWNSDCMQQHVELSHFAFLFSPHPPVPLREIFIRFGEVTHIYYSFCSPGVKLPMQLQCCETWRELCFGLQHAALAGLQYATLCNTSYCCGGMGGICINWIGI